jgi:hypothetical protein
MMRRRRHEADKRYDADQRGAQMKKELFNDLVASIKEAGKIHRGEMPATREFTFDREGVRRASKGAREPVRHEKR